MSKPYLYSRSVLSGKYDLHSKSKFSCSKSIGIINPTTKRQLMVSTPLMMNWGVKCNNNNGPSYSLSLQFPREDFKTDKTDEFLNMLKSMEQQILQDAVKNSREWFGKNTSKEVIEAFWNPMLK